jgi:hypothetical protein
MLCIVFAGCCDPAKIQGATYVHSALLCNQGRWPRKAKENKQIRIWLPSRPLVGTCKQGLVRVFRGLTFRYGDIRGI